MSQLMSNDHPKSCYLVGSWRVLLKEEFIAVGNTARELHRPYSKLWTENHVEFAPVAGGLEESLIKFYWFINEGEYIGLLFLCIGEQLRVKVDPELHREYLWVIEA